MATKALSRSRKAASPKPVLMSARDLLKKRAGEKYFVAALIGEGKEPEIIFAGKRTAAEMTAMGFNHASVTAGGVGLYATVLPWRAAKDVCPKALAAAFTVSISA
jgi:hypothetical protein